MRYFDIRDIPNAEKTTRVKKGRAQLTAGQLQDATSLIREASTLAPHDPRVMESRDALNAYCGESELIYLCNAAIGSKNEICVKKLTNAATDDNYTAKDAARCIRLLLDQCALDDTAKAQVISAISKSANGCKGLAKMVHEHRVDTFADMWVLGDVCVDTLVRIALMPEAWEVEKARLEALRGIFILLLAKAQDSNAIYQETAMRSIARLMAADGTFLLPLINDENLATVLSFLDVNQPTTLKSRATLVVTKFLEASTDRGKLMLKEYVTSRFARNSSNDVIATISVAAVIFPLIPEMAATMFLTPKFVEDLVHMARQSSTRMLRQSILDLLSAACVDKACRLRIQKICVPWLEEVLDSKAQDGNSTLAGLVLSKLGHLETQESSGTGREDETKHKVVSMFKAKMTKSTIAEIQISVEGLAYISIHSSVKEQLANDQEFLKALIKVLLDAPEQGSLQFGGLTIVSNLTSYAPVLSAENKRMAQLKAYANQMKFYESDAMDDEMHVTRRCKSLIDTGVATLLLKTVRQASPVVLNVIASILLSLSRERNHCGIIVQQGLAGVILQLARMGQSDDVRRQSAHALARILISVPPDLFFASGARSINECITPLNFLLSHLELQDPYSAFDALRALTNIASFNEASARLVSDSCFLSIAVYLQASRSAQQQAAVECVCNLSYSDHFLLSHYVFRSDEGEPFGQDFGMENAATNPKEVQFQYLVLLTSSKTRGTRIAAMGALAIIVGMTLGRRMLIKAPNGLEYVLAAWSEAQTAEAGEAIGLIGDNAYSGDVDMRMRASCVVYEVCCSTDDIEIHRKLVRHGLMKLLTEGSKHLPRDQHVRDQLVAYSEPIEVKLKQVFSR